MEIEQASIFELQLNERFRETGKWAKYGSFIGFAQCIIAFVHSLAIYIYYHGIHAVALWPYELSMIACGIAIVPFYYLLQYAQRVANATEGSNQEDFDSAVEALWKSLKISAIFGVILTFAHSAILIHTVILFMRK